MNAALCGRTRWLPGVDSLFGDDIVVEVDQETGIAYTRDMWRPLDVDELITPEEHAAAARTTSALDEMSGPSDLDRLADELEAASAAGVVAAAVQIVADAARQVARRRR